MELFDLEITRCDFNGTLKEQCPNCKKQLEIEICDSFDFSHEQKACLRFQCCFCKEHFALTIVKNFRSVVKEGFLIYDPKELLIQAL